MPRFIFAVVMYAATNQLIAAAPADLVIHNAKVITVDSKFSIAQAIAVRGDKILAVGKNKEINRFIGANTRVIDARGKTILPGLIDSHVHSYRAAVSEFGGSSPVIHSIVEAQKWIREQAASKPPGSWIVLERVYPTRLKENRLPTKVELDAAAPNNPVYWNCGPVSVANSMALEISGITKQTPDPLPGEIVKDPKNGEPTGLLRNAAQLLKVSLSAIKPTPDQQREAVKHLHRLYNQQGITSIGERRADPEAIDLFRDLKKSGDLSVRVNCTRLMEPVPKTVNEAIKKLDEMISGSQLPTTSSRRSEAETDGSQLSTNNLQPKYGPTGIGDDWVRIGPLKVFLDGGVLIGTAYMCEPWGTNTPYQITDPDYRGILNVKPEILQPLYTEAARRGWQLTAHCTGEAAVDTLLDCYEKIQAELDIRARRFLITHANFQSEKNFARCEQLGIAADVQPAWLYKDGASLLQTLGEPRMKWFQPLRSWFERGLVIGGGSDHMVQLDSVESTNPWNPWLGMWIALTRQTEHGGAHNPREHLTREQAIRLYTINNAWLNFEEKKKGSLEAGKYADLILIDRDILKCPVNEVRTTKVLMTMVGGKIVWEGERSRER